MKSNLLYALTFLIFSLCLAIPIASVFHMIDRADTPITLPVQKTVNMRYFFVAYTMDGYHGMYLLNRTDFPSLDSLRINIGNKNNSNKDRVFITEIYEFKNEADFNNFIK